MRAGKLTGAAILTLPFRSQGIGKRTGLPVADVVRVGYYGGKDAGWLPVPTTVDLKRKRLRATIRHFSLWDDLVMNVSETAVGMAQATGQLLGQRRGPAACKSGLSVPSWVVASTDNSDEIAIRTCAEGGDQGRVVVQIANNRPYGQILRYGTGVAFGWHERPSGTSSLSTAVMDEMVGPNELYLPPLSSASVGLDRRAFGFAQFTAEVTPETLVADALDLAVDGVGGIGVQSKVVEAFAGKLAASCAGFVQFRVDGHAVSVTGTDKFWDYLRTATGCASDALPTLLRALAKNKKLDWKISTIESRLKLLRRVGLAAEVAPLANLMATRLRDMSLAPASFALAARLDQSAVSGPALALATGNRFSCGVRSGGQVSCWGDGRLGQLGNGGSASSSLPVLVSGITDATTIDAGDGHACAVRATGTISCWGDGRVGQLGQGSMTSSSAPAPVSGLNDAKAVSVSGQRSCALRAGGTVSCWGAGARDLGGFTLVPSSVPVSVDGITDATALATSDEHVCVLRHDGTILCWGDNEGGELGNGGYESSTVPALVSGISGATGIAGGSHSTCALRTSGRVSCWGDNGWGQLGNGTISAESTVPVDVAELSDATSLAGGWSHWCAVRATGVVGCWGGPGALGNGDGNSLTPVSVFGISDANAVAAGWSHSCALRTGGRVSCWGSGALGALGSGGTTTSYVPVDVIGFP